MGFWFTFSRSKQRNRLEETTICVPRRQQDWIPCSDDSGRKPLDYDPASVIDAYFEAVMTDLDCKREDLRGGFFKGTHGKEGKRFIKANVGKNTLATVGIEIASELCLRDPETYTGHCWRRSAGTNASNAGVNVTTLMGMMGWSCPKTAMQYVKRSRITSLQMSMYLANVQRRNCSDPFPSRTVRRSRKTLFAKEKKPSVKTDSLQCSTDRNLLREDVDKEVVSFSVSNPKTDECLSPSFDVDNFESEICTQELLNDSFVVPDLSENSGVVESDCRAVRSIQPDLLVVQPSNTSTTTSLSLSDGSSSATPASSSVFDLSSIDPRLINVLQNLQNHGSIQISFNFGDVKK